MTSEEPTGVLWLEKHRPTKLEDVAIDDDSRAVLNEYLKVGEIPHLLFWGPPGTGKTTLARIIYKKLDCRVMTLNASAERGIETVRQKIGAFVTARTEARWQIVFLDESDSLTPDAQTALRNMIESYADRARFILTANKVEKIIQPVRSRCQEVILKAPPLKERFRILTEVLKKEGITAPPQIVLTYANKYTDLRLMLSAAQKGYLAKGTLPPAMSETVADGNSMFDMVLKRNWASLRSVTSSDGFDPQSSLREIFWAIPDEHPKVGMLRHVFARGVHETGYTPDPIVLFLGVCAEAMEGL